MMGNLTPAIANIIDYCHSREEPALNQIGDGKL